MASQPRASLRTKIIAWSFIPTTIILSLVALTTYAAYQQVTQEMVITRDEELTRLTASELSTGFEEYIDRLNNLARQENAISGDPVSMQAALDQEINRLVFFDGGVYMLDNQGVVVATPEQFRTLMQQNWSNRSFFEKMVRSPGLFFSNIEPYGPEGQNVIALAVPILGRNNEFHGVAVGFFKMDVTSISPFYGTILKLRIGRNGGAYLLDGNKRVIFSSGSNAVGSAFSDNPVSTLLESGRSTAMRTRSVSGQDVVAAYAPVPRTEWSLITEESWATLVRPSQRYRQYLTLLLGLGVLIPTIFVMYGVRRITRPIQQFNEAAQRIAGGDFSQQIEVNTGDEMEELADQFNSMAVQLRESYANLELRVAQRTQELTALNTVAAVVSRTLSLEQILSDALDVTIQVMGMEGGVVFRIDAEKEMLDLVAYRHISKELLMIIKRLPLERNVVDEVINNRMPVIRPVSDYPPGLLRHALEKAGLKLVVSIPLMTQDKLLGAMSIASTTVETLTPEQLAVPAAIGQQIGVALDNARLYEQSVAYAQEMELARQAADAANAAKSDFLANVSHELRTPLASILGFAHLVQRRFEERIFPALPEQDGRIHRATDQIEENLGIILSEGQRLTGLINDLLDLEKIEAGQMVWQMQLVEIGDVIQRAVASTNALLAEKSLRIVQEVSAGLPRVTGDPNRLLQVLINLISNSIKFTAKGSITVGARLENDEMWVWVKDEGIGIALADQKIIFEKFRQVGDTLTGKPKGTGLGLAISRQIVEKHGGHIWVESEKGQGSTFTFSLPVVNGLEQPADKVERSANIIL